MKIDVDEQGLFRNEHPWRVLLFHQVQWEEKKKKALKLGWESVQMVVLLLLRLYTNKCKTCLLGPIPAPHSGS